jgi:hypothetical protein
MNARFLGILLFILSFGLGCQSYNQGVKEPSTFIGKSVGELMEYYRLDFQGASFYDEPPGKLKQIRFSQSDKFPGNELVVQLRYTEMLFSDKREWRPEMISKSVIENIILKPTQ